MAKVSAFLLLLATVGLWSESWTAPTPALQKTIFSNGKPVAKLPLDIAGPYDTVWSSELFEGDIAGVDVDQLREQTKQNPEGKNAVLHADRWPNGIIPYTISDRFNADERVMLEKAIEEINNQTEGISLVPRNGQRHSVFVARGGPDTGCWSYVGLIGGEQILNLEVLVNPGDAHCMWHGIIQHEFLHAIGLYHEQSRTDRDEHVEINWDNIRTNQRHNFEFYSDSYVTHFGLNYDYDSLMHYGKFDFAIDRNIWTIKPVKPHEDVPIGQRRGLSETDIAKLNLMYPKSEN